MSLKVDLAFTLESTLGIFTFYYSEVVDLLNVLFKIYGLIRTIVTFVAFEIAGRSMYIISHSGFVSPGNPTNG